MIEWCVSTTVFSDKPVGLITASANGVKGQEELKLIMETIQAKFMKETMLLIQGVKGKVSEAGEIVNKETKNELENLIFSFNKLIQKMI